ncbi:BTB-POZ domain containing protein [Pyrenophora tritici-repentis]|uniref:BTB-POZ domain containing protein n=1 Tax=Pyrenophora tritici-repentis TaxID=45151 RepID=A0A922N1X3_9PLEO|nr:BTB-POZ domain containing protein [Pyrenophora tritici-repentis]KAI1670864.1 BTB-POZ domain containing protein [Pyrenophora tritici-repentis]KAI1684601.1 BTB-POZ domain containing protein [Pyrenophora tritici-repentis]
MSDRSGAASRDFVFQTSDQAGGGASQPNPQYNGYHAGHDTNAAEVAAAGQAHGYDASAAYHDYSAQQHQVVASQYAGYSFGPAPTGWDWTNSVDFTDFAHQYEPQGELVQEFQNQANPTNDFSIPLPVTTGEAAYQVFQQNQSATPTPNALQAQISHSPPPPPPSVRPQQQQQQHHHHQHQLQPQPQQPQQPQQQQRPVVQTGMKRKIDSEPTSAASQASAIAVENPPKRQNKSRQSSDASTTSPIGSVPAEPRPSPMSRTTAQTATSEVTPQPVSRENTQTGRRKEQSKGTGPQGRVIDVSTPRKIQESPTGLDILPAGKVFPIQIGSQLFRLSGASLSSDAPSYFSHFFGQQLHDNGGRAGDVRTLYIDRDPETFRDIALHLQGYHITPKSAEHFVKLFADAQFYSLPRLTKQLFSTDIFVNIGGTPFQVPRDIFSAPGDSPNYFSLGFAHFFSTPSEVFPGLDRDSLLRPPSIKPPSVPGRNGEIFGELMQLLQGYNMEIRSDAHRARLLRDARYFHLKGLEQKLIPCEISYNLNRQQSEILVRLEDIRQSGISFNPDKFASDSDSESVSGGQSTGFSPNGLPAVSPAPSTSSSSAVLRAGYVSYARPYTDDHANSNVLVLEISTGETTSLYLPRSAPRASMSGSLNVNLRATFYNSTLARVTSLFSVVASKMGLPATQPLGLMYLQSGGGVAAQPVSPANSGVSERRVRVRLDTDCALQIDGAAAELSMDRETGCVGIRRIGHGRDEWLWGGDKVADNDASHLRADDQEAEVEWTIKRAHWRIRVEPIESDADGKRMQVILCGVKLEAFTVERTRNSARGFLCSN